MFEQAIRSIWYRLGANVGIDIRALHLTEYADRPSFDADAAAVERLDQIQNLYGEAHLRLTGMVIVGELRTWASDGDNWKRPSPDGLKARLMRAADEPWELYVDRIELATAFPARWPDEFNLFDATENPKAIATEHKSGGPGRPSGSGSYAEDDAPLLIEMRELMNSGAARSSNRASIMVAHKAAGGGSEDSKARRLRNRFRQHGY